MLPVEAQQRLMGVVPDELEAKYQTSSGTIRSHNFTFRDEDNPENNHLYWGYVSDEPNYPVVVLDLNPTGVLYEQNRSLDTLLYSAIENEAEGTIKQVHGEPMFDELTVLFAMQESNVTKASPSKIAKTVAGELYAHYCAADLNYQGGDFEWPMRIEPMSGPSQLTRTSMGESVQMESDVERWQFTMRVYYTMSWEVITQSANRLDIDVSLDVDGDGTPDSTRNYSIDLSGN